MKHSAKITALLMIIFLIHQFFALFIISRNMQSLGEPYPETELSYYAILLPIFIIIFSLLFIFLRKFGLIIKYWHLLALILCTFLTLSSIVEQWIAIILAIIIIALRKLLKNEVMDNLSELLVYPALVLVLLPLLNTLSVIVLLAIISIYDVLAVYYSKHMIILAKTQLKSGIFSGIKISMGKNNAIIGGGDIAFSMLFACSIFRDYGFLGAISSIAFSSLALLLLLALADKKKFYPAMPFITIGSIIGFSLTLLINLL